MKRVLALMGLACAVLVAPLGDMTWARMDAPVWADILEFHTAVRKVHPDRLFAFGFTGMYDYEKAGFTPEQVRSFSDDMVKLGIVWQVQPIWAVGGLNITAEIASFLSTKEICSQRASW